MKLIFVLFLLANLIYPQVISATMYEPGETLEPDCAPGSENCGVIVTNIGTTDLTLTGQRSLIMDGHDLTFVGTADTVVSDNGDVTVGGDLTISGDNLFLGTSTLHLGTANADPSGTNGATYYNSETNKFRCFENNAWINCINSDSSGANLQHAASYDTSQEMRQIPIGGAQITLGTVSVTPATATGDVYVAGWSDVYSRDDTDQSLQISIETTGDCTGTTIGNASLTYRINSRGDRQNDQGSLRVSGVALDPGVSTQVYSLCAAVISGESKSNIKNWGLEAAVFNRGTEQNIIDNSLGVVAEDSGLPDLPLIQSEIARNPLVVITDKLALGKKFLTDLVVARLTAIRGYFDEIFVKKVHTEQLCVRRSDGREVCVNGDQVNSLFPSANIIEPIPTGPISSERLINIPLAPAPWVIVP